MSDLPMIRTPPVQRIARSRNTYSYSEAGRERIEYENVYEYV
jgi:hypothetical protein